MSIVDRVAQRFAAQEHLGVAPPGWENTVKKMKKHDEIDNPWALAWHMKNKGDTPGGKKEGEEKEEAEASISRPGPMASQVLKRAGFQPDGSVLRELEAANVHEGDGGLFLSIFENESPARTAGKKPYRSYKLSSRVSHYGVGMESEFPLSSSNAVRWLIGALQRTLPVIEANESSYQRTEYKARPTVMNGTPVPDTRQFSTWQSEAESK
jgi:hypothetical protein